MPASAPRGDSGGAPLLALGLAVALVAPTEVATAVEARRVALVASGQKLARDQVGYYMDVQEARLRQVVSASVRVERVGERVSLNLPGRLSFDVGSAALSPAAVEALSGVALVLAEYRFSVVSLHGHTDSSGNAAVNNRLSQERALSVARYLIDNGVEAQRIVVSGYGDRAPIASNETPEGREANRRVEVQLDPVYE